MRRHGARSAERKERRRKEGGKECSTATIYSYHSIQRSTSAAGLVEGILLGKEREKRRRKERKEEGRKGKDQLRTPTRFASIGCNSQEESEGMVKRGGGKEKENMLFRIRFFVLNCFS